MGQLAGRSWCHIVSQEVPGLCGGVGGTPGTEGLGKSWAVCALRVTGVGFWSGVTYSLPPSSPSWAHTICHGGLWVLGCCTSHWQRKGLCGAALRREDSRSGGEAGRKQKRGRTRLACQAWLTSLLLHERLRCLPEPFLLHPAHFLLGDYLILIICLTLWIYL